MQQTEAFGVILAILGAVLLIAAVKRKSQVLLNFLVRTVLGAICVIFTNDYLAAQGIALAVGLNPVSLLTLGTLGVGGFALLYGIVACKFL